MHGSILKTIPWIICELFYVHISKTLLQKLELVVLFYSNNWNIENNCRYGMAFQNLLNDTLRKKLSVFGVILVRILPYSNWVSLLMVCTSPYTARMREITDHNNSEYGHFLRSVSRRNLASLKKPCFGRICSMCLQWIH